MPTKVIEENLRGGGGQIIKCEQIIYHFKVRDL